MMKPIKSWFFVLATYLNRVQTSESERSKTNWEYMLHGELLYQVSDQVAFVYAVETLTQKPTLSQMDESEYAFDDWSVGKGNFNLKSTRQVRHRLNGSVDRKTIDFGGEVEYSCRYNQISFDIHRETDRFVWKWENQRKWQNLNLMSWVRWNINKWVFVSGSLIYRNFISEGKTYKQKASDLDYKVEVQGMYKNWMLYFSMGEQGNSLTGEIRDYAKKEDILFLRYRLGNLNVSAGIQDFLGSNYKSIE